jgi:triosephosphate isomerase
MRRPLIAGNWKMNKTPEEAADFFRQLRPLMRAVSHCDIVVCPPSVDLHAALEATQGSNAVIGAQNLHWGREGAFTGEVSGQMLRAMGCHYVIVGHSERRQYFGETDADVQKKTAAAIEFGLTPIVCVGEHLEHREAGETDECLRCQFEGGLDGLSAAEFAKVVIAYEPVWAIGTGKTATPEIAAQVHQYLRAMAAKKFGDAVAATTRILYGGSVKPDNIAALMAEDDIDGALVGGASLDPKSFAAIVRYK